MLREIYETARDLIAIALFAATVLVIAAIIIAGNAVIQ